MNQILLRTNKGEYRPGEEIYGVVYLSIVNPTAGRGVKLKFKGNEFFIYHLPDDPVNSSDQMFIKDQKDYIDCNNVSLFTADSSLMLGDYAFPFQLKLLSEIPGSFKFGQIGSKDNAKWDGYVKYWLEAEVIDARTVKTEQPLLVYHDLPKGYDPGALPAVCIKHQFTHWMFFTQTIFITARLMDHTWTSGRSAKLRLIVTNDTKLNVTSVIIRLIRTILLKSKKSGPIGVVVWEREINDCNQNVLNKGLDNILIPLLDKNGAAVPPTVSGHYIECKYSIEVVTRLSNGSASPLTVPIPRILPDRNQEWHTWKPPEWVYNTTVKSAQGLFQVPQNVLSSEVFSGIPGFQAL
ncbi:hypothetical protein ScPMuIL_004437 [Solemya velum]